MLSLICISIAEISLYFYFKFQSKVNSTPNATNLKGVTGTNQHILF